MLSGKSSRPESTPTKTARTGSMPVLCRRLILISTERDCTRRYDGRNGVLVDHLGDGVAQQNDVLIKGFNIALQLDAVNQVNRYGNVLFAQGIQEGILK